MYTLEINCSCSIVTKDFGILKSFSFKPFLFYFALFSFDETVFNLCSYAKTWTICINKENMQELMPVLEAAKVRQSNNPRNLKIRMNFECCKILGKIDAIGNRSLQLPGCLNIKQVPAIFYLYTLILNFAFFNGMMCSFIMCIQFYYYW